MPQGFKAKVTFFVSHGLTGQARTCFAALTEITNTPAPKVIILKVCSVLSKLHLSYISSEHTYTQCETKPNCAHCCLSWFTLNAPERQDRGSTLKTAEWQQLRISSVWGKVSLVLFYWHTNAIGLPFGVQKTVGDSLVELLSQCWEGSYCQALILASSDDPYWWLHPCNTWDMMEHEELAIMFIFTLRSLATKRLNAFCSCGFMWITSSGQINLLNVTVALQGQDEKWNI